MPDISQITSLALALLDEQPITTGPFFRALSTQALQSDMFLATQKQFFFAVTFFPRPMSALVGRISDPTARLDILRNLVEEHGDFDTRNFHHTTFRTLLSRLGVSEDTIDTQPLWPCVRAFNSTLITACVHDEIEVGIACMGMIELAFAGVSAHIGKAIVANGWLSKEDLIHYTLHEKIDERHAEEFFAVIAKSWDTPNRRYVIDQGLRMGRHLLDALYSGLLDEALRHQGEHIPFISPPTSTPVI